MILDRFSSSPFTSVERHCDNIPRSERAKSPKHEERKRRNQTKNCNDAGVEGCQSWDFHAPIVPLRGEGGKGVPLRKHNYCGLLRVMTGRENAVPWMRFRRNSAIG